MHGIFFNKYKMHNFYNNIIISNIFSLINYITIIIRNNTVMTKL